MYASVSPQAIIPPSLIITPYCPDVVIHNKSINVVVLLDLTCPLDSIQHLESARDRKQTKEDYLLYQLGIGGCTQKAEHFRGVYP